jgi:4-aminobutyrate aminotransferase-like enzyme
MSHSKNEQLLARKAAATPCGAGVMGTFFAERAQGAELRDAQGRPDADFTRRVQSEALERGLILLSCGVDANVLRFLFPLTTPQPVFDEAMFILGDSLLAATS